jgi:hypothetical protein
MRTVTLGLNIPLMLFHRNGFVVPKRHIGVHPAGTLAPSLDLAKSTDRAWLAAHCAGAGATGQGFAARDDHPTLLFHPMRQSGWAHSRRL